MLIFLMFQSEKEMIEADALRTESIRYINQDQYDIINELANIEIWNVPILTKIYIINNLKFKIKPIKDSIDSVN